MDDPLNFAVSKSMHRIVNRKLSAEEISVLSLYLCDRARPEGTLTFHELQGFLFTVACSPEPIMPTDWLPIISDEKDMGYQDLDEAQRIVDLIMTLYNQINTAAIERDDAMPANCEFLEDINANFSHSATVSQWSRGFALGYDWLSELWDDYIPDELDEMNEELGVLMMTLSFFGSRELAEAYYNEVFGKKRRRKPSFEAFASSMRELFPSALASYAHIGRTIGEVLASN